MPDHFALIPIDIIDSDRWRALGLTAVRTYVAVASFANGDRRAWPSIETLSRIVGVDQRNVRRALGELERSKLIARQIGGGRGRSTVYELLETGAQCASVSNDKPGRSAPAFQGEKGGRTAHKTLAHGAQNTGAVRQPNRKNIEKQKELPPAASSSVLVSLLKQAGIGDPLRSRVCESKLSTERVQQIVEQGGDSRATAQRLIDAIGQAETQAVADAEREQREREEREHRRAMRGQAEAEALTGEARRAALEAMKAARSRASDNGDTQA